MSGCCPCSVPACGEVVYARGFCNMHYQRFRRHGEPLAEQEREPPTAHGEPARFLREDVLSFEGDDCLLWPHWRSGYGYGLIRLDGRTRYVHDLVCTHMHGPKPTPVHEVGHLCGNGNYGCVSPAHLRWVSRTENHADRKRARLRLAL